MALRLLPRLSGPRKRPLERSGWDAVEGGRSRTLGRHRSTGSLYSELKLSSLSDGVQPARNRSRVRSWFTLPRLRRLSQILCLTLFVAHVCNIEYRGTLHPGEAEIRLPFPVRVVLASDPLVGVANALATHALYRGLIWGLAILIPALFLGRFFCGWMCPLGTMCHFVSTIRSGAKSGPRRIASNRYKSWQSLKYYLL